MNAEIVTCGTELLLGSIVDTNSAWLSRMLAEAGIDVYYKTTAGDNAGRFLSAVKAAAERSDVILVTGGLGPTVDDITRNVISDFTGKKLVRHEEIVRYINEMFRKTGRQPASNNNVQADIPEGAVILKNPYGSAPGFIVEHKGKIIAAMPGVPREMKPMFKEQVLPYLMEKSGPAKKCLKFVEMRVAGMPESAVDEKIKDLFMNSVNPSIGVMCRTDEIIVRITASAASVHEADIMIAGLKDKVAQRLEGFYFADEPVTMEEVLGTLLKEKERTISTAESCTSGMIAARITNVSGSSSYYRGGINVYSNEAKAGLLGVNEETLKQHGAVSEQCAREMAEKCAEKFGTDTAVAVTGIAGPEGGSAEKPVGLVYTGIKIGDDIKVHKNVFTGDREAVRQRAATNAMFMLINGLRSLE